MGMNESRWHELPMREIPTAMCFVISDQHQDQVGDPCPHVVWYTHDYFVVENANLIFEAKQKKAEWILARVLNVPSHR